MARPKKQTSTPVRNPDGIDDDNLRSDAAARKEKTPRKRPPYQAGVLPSVQRLNVKDLIPTEENARAICEHSTAFMELAASVRASGVKMPVIVRPHPLRPGKYDLRAGARRLRAAELANLKQIPAMVYEGLSDEDAFDLTFFENYGREDLTPMEEAMAAAILLEHHHGDLQAVADKFDKPLAWVKRRSYVHEHLVEEWKVAVAKEGCSFDRWTISHLELIARFDGDTQRRFLKELNGWKCPETVEELAAYCNQQLRTLKKAKWDTDEVYEDAEGHAITPCSACVKRSSVQPLLWQADAAADEIEQEDRCLDGVCWEAKLTAYLKREMEHKQQQYPEMTPAIMNADYQEKANIKQHFRDAEEIKYSTHPAKKSDADAKPYFIIGGESAGKVVWRKPIEGKSPSAPKGKMTKKTVTDRQQELDSKRHNYVLKQLPGLIRQSEVTRLVYKDRPLAMLALINSFGTANRMLSNSYALVAEQIDEDNPDAVIEQLWEQLLPRLIASVAYNGPITQVPECKIVAGIGVCTLLQIDYEALMEQARAAIPTPKSLAKVEGQRLEDPDGDAEENEDSAEVDDAEE